MTLEPLCDPLPLSVGTWREVEHVGQQVVLSVQLPIHHERNHSVVRDQDFLDPLILGALLSVTVSSVEQDVTAAVRF